MKIPRVIIANDNFFHGFVEVRKGDEFQLVDIQEVFVLYENKMNQIIDIPINKISTMKFYDEKKDSFGYTKGLRYV